MIMSPEEEALRGQALEELALEEAMLGGVEPVVCPQCGFDLSVLEQAPAPPVPPVDGLTDMLPIG